MRSRFKDGGQSIHSFAGVFLVRCPKCDGCARVVGPDQQGAVAKLTCVHCGYSKAGGCKGRWLGEARDWYLGLPLWLQVSCCGEVLWAYNPEHLSFLNDYVEAGHRVGLTQEEAAEIGIRNATAASRLPEWVICAKNRAAVLKCVKRLQVLAARS